MNVVIDTNVFISGFIWSGFPGKIIEAWQDGKIHLVVSTEILDEYNQVAERISKKYGISLKHFIDLIVSNCTVVAISKKNKPISKDPDDDKFLYAALESKTEFIISGDKHLLDLNGYKELTVLKPKAFVEKYLK